MTQTQFLNLIKPAPNTINWGTALNQNFDILDTQYGILLNQISALRTQLGQLGLYYSDPIYTPYLTIQLFESNTVDKAYLVLQDGGEELVIYRDEQFQSLNYIVDYSMFFVKIVDSDGETIHTLPENVEVNIGGIQWSNDDIAVKVTTFNYANKQNESKFIRMPQTIGGYYAPTNYQLTDTDEAQAPTLKYVRKNSSDATAEYEGPALYVKPTSVVGNEITFKYAQCVKEDGEWKEQELDAIAAKVTYPQVTTESSSVQLTIDEQDIEAGSIIADTAVLSSDYNITGVEFYTKSGENDNNYEPIKLGHYFVASSKTWYIYVDCKNLTASQQIQMVVNYSACMAT